MGTVEGVTASINTTTTHCLTPVPACPLITPKHPFNAHSLPPPISFLYPLITPKHPSPPTHHPLPHCKLTTASYSHPIPPPPTPSHHFSLFLPSSHPFTISSPSPNYSPSPSPPFSSLHFLLPTHHPIFSSPTPLSPHFLLPLLTHQFQVPSFSSSFSFLTSHQLLLLPSPWALRDFRR